MPELLESVSSRSKTGNWVITDGPNLVWFCEKGTPARSLAPPVTTEASQTGSGDVFLAGLIHATSVRAKNLDDAVAFALPLAAANAASETVATFDLHPFGL
jgi:fructose-1-phosphate kinase PfkB-like protein